MADQRLEFSEGSDGAIRGSDSDEVGRDLRTEIDPVSQIAILDVSKCPKGLVKEAALPKFCGQVIDGSLALFE